MFQHKQPTRVATITPMSDGAELAQYNIARAHAPLDSPVMAEFMARLDEVNGLADGHPGFVWRLQSDNGSAAYLRPYDDDRLLVNMSVWRSLEELRAFVYKSGHAAVVRRREEWFGKAEAAYQVLWWVPAGHRPSVEEGKARLAQLQERGPSAAAFTFKAPFSPDEGLAVWQRSAP
jgi:heme-degrading monooxygenase HmoA